MLSIFTLEVFVLFVLSYASALFKNRNFTLLVSITLLLFVSFFYGFRDIVIYNPDGFTTDTYRYALVWFDEIKTINDIFYGSSSWKADYLFFTIPYFVNFFSDNPNIYLFINAFISFLILFIGYFKLFDKSKYYLFPLMIFLILVTSTVAANYGNLLRQGLAISLFVLSLSYMLQKKYFIGYLILFLALFSHKSIIVFFPFYFIIFHTNVKLKYYIALLIASIPFIFFNVVSFVSGNLFALSEKLNVYQESNSRMLVYKIIILLILAFFIYIFIYKKRYSNSFEKVFKIFLLTLITSLIFFKIEIISGRLLYYPSILLPYFIIYSFNYIKQKEFYFFSISIITVLYAYFILLSSSTYKTIHFTNTLF